MKKKIPPFKSDKQAEAFVAEADLSEFDLSGAKPMRFEFAQKDERVNMRAPASLLSAVKAAAALKKFPINASSAKRLKRP